MPAPPAYHMVVDPHAPIPNVQSPYTHEEEHEEREEDDEDDDTPEITINAATQIRGTGNIVSIAQMDSVRIANLIAVLLKGEDLSKAASSPQQSQAQAQAHSPPDQSPLATLANLATAAAKTEEKKLPKMHITVNCGATIIGDRNIVGPGLGDIARQMQLAQRNHAMQMQQQQQQQQATGCQKMPSPTQRRETLYQAQAAMAQPHGTLCPGQAPTPPMSRSSSLQSDASAGLKRKFEGDLGDGVAKKRC